MKIADPRKWAAHNGYELRVSHLSDTMYAMSGNTAIGILHKETNGYKFTGIADDTPNIPIVNNDERKPNIECASPMLSQSLSFGFKPLELNSLTKGTNEIPISGQVSGTGLSERISDCNYWLPYAAEHYHISRDIRDYVLVPVPALFSELPNTNGDSLTLGELLRFLPDHGMQMYKTFKGQPTHVEHCFPGDAPIQTKDGFKPIKSIKVGDRVLTDRLRYKKVVRVYKNGTKHISSIKCFGLPGPIYATSNHPMMVVDRRQVSGKLTNEGKRDYRIRRDGLCWEDLTPHYRPVSDIYHGDYLVMPISIGGDVRENADFAFLAGVYAAEGSFNKGRQKSNFGELTSVVLTIGAREAEFSDEILRCCERLGYKCKMYPYPKRGVRMIIVQNQEFALRMKEMFGEYSHLKRIGGIARKWDADTMCNFLGGYISGDGCAKGARLRCVTVSKDLAYDVQQALAFVGVPATICLNPHYGRKLKRADREYAIRDRYTIGASVHEAEFLNDYIVGKEIRVATEWSAHTKCVIVGNYMLMPVNDVQHAVRKERVYNLEVEDDHTYTAYNVIVHNCNKDITQAKGVILDSFLRPLPFNNRYYKVVLLQAFDRTKDPDLVNQILSKAINSYSVGFYYTSYACSICNHVVGRGINLTPCEHTQMHRGTYRCKDGRLAYRKCQNGKGFESSAVKSPAYVSNIGTHVIDVRMM